MSRRVTRIQPRSSLSATSGIRPDYLRILVASLIGLLLLGTAFRASANGVAGLVPNYGGGTAGDDSLSSGAIAGIAAGVGLGAAAAAGVFAGGADECEEPRRALPERVNQISEIRLVPSETTLDAGECRCFFLEVRAADDKEWYSVTHRSTSSIELQEKTECVVKRDGSKNVFCVPIDAPKSCDGKSVTVVGTYTHPGGGPMTATARIRVRIPQDQR